MSNVSECCIEKAQNLHSGAFNYSTTFSYCNKFLHSSGLMSAIFWCQFFQFSQLAGSWASPRHSLDRSTSTISTHQTVLDISYRLLRAR